MKQGDRGIKNRDRFGRIALHVAAEQGLSALVFATLAREDCTDAPARLLQCVQVFGQRGPRQAGGVDWRGVGSHERKWPNKRQQQPRTARTIGRQGGGIRGGTSFYVNVRRRHGGRCAVQHYRS